ncbi:Adenylate cyclase (ATP pyrophosphate-lyase) (Adenylyl cyclase) [Durusdinium trenchii]|uniref:Adenylate cyclase (ATP pyrophosphate-lyase) (Adenylyl cyclase) n=1 Tax=Durusdinium trenchii TaxID=1381693 RepID=A0ABP0HF72_9DINO
MTTRRVIILVLVMLLFLPQFDPAGNVFNAVSDFQDSAKFGSSMIFERWRDWCGSSNTTIRPWCLDALSTPSENQELHYRNRYELEVALLQFLHSHISGGFLFRLYWIGAVSRLWVDSTYLGQLAPLNQARWLGQDLRVDPASLDDAWKNRVEAAGYLVLVPERKSFVLAKYQEKGIEVLKLEDLHKDRDRRPRVRAILHEDGTGSVKLSDPNSFFDGPGYERPFELVTCFLEDLGYTGHTSQTCAKFWFANALGHLTVYPIQDSPLAVHKIIKKEASKACLWKRNSGKLAFFLPVYGQSEDTQTKQGFSKPKTMRETYGSKAAQSIFMGGGPFMLKDSKDLTVRALKRLRYLNAQNTDEYEAMLCFVNQKNNRNLLRKMDLLPEPSDFSCDVKEKLRAAFLSSAYPPNWRKQRTARDQIMPIVGLLEAKGFLSKTKDTIGDYCCSGYSKSGISEAIKMHVKKLQIPSVWDSTYARSDFYQGPVGSAISTATKQRLINNWQEECQTAVGVVVQPEVRAMVSTGCSITAELRCSEVEYVTPLTYSSQESDSFSFVFAFDQRGFTQLEAAGLSIVQTLFICFAVGVGAMTFSKDANELLLNPIERMIEKMETIKDNPLEAMRLGDLEFRREEVEEARFREKLAQMSRPWQILYKYRHAKKYKEPMETVMLEKTIIKLGGLLALGFGEAGAEVIGQNMKVSATAGVNAMVPGSKVDAIIGFCNIRHFMEATEVLKEKVMLFVNQVGEIVHGCVDDFHGAPNRNIGDAFLVIWRLSGSSEEKQTKLADMALMSYVKIVAEVNKFGAENKIDLAESVSSRSRILAGYRWHPGFQYRIKDFRVSMGFGLHHGWAIEAGRRALVGLSSQQLQVTQQMLQEGAIGSEYKIDASYLSPNVSVAAKLEAATSQFKVWMLLSHSMVNKCSHEVALSCRLIDQVTVSGSRIPMRIYTMDLDTRRTSNWTDAMVVHDTIAVEEKGPDRIIRNRFKIRQLREVRKGEKMAEDDVSHMRALFSEEFFQRFHMAYRNYEEGHSLFQFPVLPAGEWLAARDMLYTCHYQPRPDIGRRLVQSEADPARDTVFLLKP